MVLELEEIKAKKKYQENVKKTIDLDDVCNIIDDVKYRISNIDYEFKNRHIKELGSIQDELIDEMRCCEEENINGGKQTLWMKMKNFGRKLTWRMRNMFQDNC